MTAEQKLRKLIREELKRTKLNEGYTGKLDVVLEDDETVVLRGDKRALKIVAEVIGFHSTIVGTGDKSTKKFGQYFGQDKYPDGFLFFTKDKTQLFK